MDLPNTVFPYQKSNCTFSFAIEQTRNSALTVATNALVNSMPSRLTVEKPGRVFRPSN